MANISKLIVVIGLCFGAVAACSSSEESERVGVARQKLTTYCAHDFECDFGPGFFGGEHCGMDHQCHTIAEDPSCGMWAGTYPNCDYYDPCRQMYCAEGTECPGQDPYICIHPGGANPCFPYVYASECATECDDDGDCERGHTCWGGSCI